MSMNALRVVKPLKVTPAMMLESNIPEADHPEYLAATTYAKGARVMVAATHDIWESVVDANTGNTPGGDEAKWLRVGATNRWKAFDAAINTQTAAPGGLITFKVKPGQAFNSVNALNLKGAVLMKVRVTAPGLGEIFYREIPLNRRAVNPGWWAFYFGERRAPTQALMSDLPGLPNAEIDIEITGSSELAVGVILIGYERSFSLGVRTGARVGLLDFSYKERTKYGDLILQEGAFADRASFSMLLQANEVDAFKAFMKEVRAVACLWIGSRRYEATTIYGFAKSFDELLTYHDYADAELELESLI